VSDDDLRWLRSDLHRQVEGVSLTPAELDALLEGSTHRVRRQHRVQRTTAGLTLVTALAVAGGLAVGATQHHEQTPERVPPAAANGALPPRWSSQYNPSVLLRLQQCLAAGGVTSQVEGETGLRVTSPSPPASVIASCQQQPAEPVARQQLRDDELAALYAALRSRIACLAAHGSDVAVAPDLPAWRAAVRADAASAWDPYGSASPDAKAACPKP